MGTWPKLIISRGEPVSIHLGKDGVAAAATVNWVLQLVPEEGPHSDAAQRECEDQTAHDLEYHHWVGHGAWVQSHHSGSSLSARATVGDHGMPRLNGVLGVDSEGGGLWTEGEESWSSWLAAVELGSDSWRLTGLCQGWSLGEVLGSQRIRSFGIDTGVGIL